MLWLIVMHFLPNQLTWEYIMEYIREKIYQGYIRQCVVVRRDAFAHSTDPGIYQASGQGVTHPHPCAAPQLFSTLLQQTNMFCNWDKYICQFG